MLRRGERMYGADLSVLSWNLLAQDCTSSILGAQRYCHVPREDLAWSNRCLRIVEELLSADADVLCLQELNFADELSIRSPLEAAGYVGLMQKKDDPKHPTGNATFWKSSKLSCASPAVHRSRVLTVLLQDEKKRERCVAVANCHLEGNPRESLARVKQLQSTLKQLQQLRHQAVIVIGDFNCELQTSACASYLAFGFVIPGVIEWGKECPAPAAQVPGHGYVLSSAYPNDGTDFTFTIRPNLCLMLDQLWHTHDSLQLVARRGIFADASQRDFILAHGWPSAINPSDHLPIGATFNWAEKLVDLNPAPKMEELEVEDPQAEAELLLANTEAQRSEWDAATNLPELPKRQKPSPEQLAVLACLKTRKERLLAELPEEAQLILKRVAELQKKAKKAAANAATSDAGIAASAEKAKKAPANAAPQCRRWGSEAESSTKRDNGPPAQPEAPIVGDEVDPTMPAP